MKSYDHKQLAEHLTENILSAHGYLPSRFFIHGAVFPDHNPISYLQGLLDGHPMKIHFTVYSKPKVRQLIEKLEKKEALSLWGYYKLGVLTHYLADAFTYPHNETFTDNMLAHAKYESQKLHSALTEHLSGGKAIPDENLQKSKNLWHTFCTLHSTYKQASPSPQTDLAYIIPLCEMVCRELACNKMKEPAVRNKISCSHTI